jgi:hypothetical protein
MDGEETFWNYAGISAESKDKVFSIPMNSISRTALRNSGEPASQN